MAVTGTTDALRVVSIVGPGRSGTTLIGSILGEAPGFFDAGEIRWIWTRGLLEGRHCGCGRSLLECATWGPVLALVASRRGRRTLDDARDAARWQDQLSGLRYRSGVVRGSPGGPAADAMSQYTRLMAEVFSAIATTTGASTIVDTSKRAHDAAVIEGAEGLRHVVVHVVRDPRAVAFSWTRVKPIPSPDGALQMEQRGPGKSSARWVENCLGAELLRNRLPPERWAFVRYEDFAAQPASTVRRLLDRLGEPAGQDLVAPDGTARLSPNHTAAGNPNRFRSGPTQIREDVEWRRSLPRKDAFVVSALCAPLLRRYGYPLVPPTIT